MNHEIRRIKNNAFREISKLLKIEAEKSVINKEGDVIKVDGQNLKVLSIEISTNPSRESFEISYECLKLTKDLVPYKSGETIKVKQP